jgi:alkanesulfonate monooxygenase SsuD/methylene tetrahydromethanopterin reductase-like flavin-dependent oxidoreductase (luciferase family)
MRRLTAQYAEYWNAPFVHQPESIAAAQRSMDDACAKTGRDPATLQRTALVMIDQPGAYEGRLADKMRQFRYRPGVPATGTSEELAALLRALAREGISHVQLFPEPSTMVAIDALAPVLDSLDRG